jgi:hypothetical protein
LFKTARDAKKLEIKAVSDKSNINAWAAVGGSKSEMRMEMQLLAASDPAEYGRRRRAELEEVKLTVNGAYTASLQQFIDAGEDLRTAERRALESTTRIKNIAMEAFHLKFPDSDLGKYIKGTAKDANAYMEPLSSGARKKRTYRKKK